MWIGIKLKGMFANDYTKSSNVAAETNKQSSFFKPAVQAKLAVNQPNDVYEQQADQMADQVMNTNNTGSQRFFKPSGADLQRKCQHCEEEEKPVNRKENSTAGVKGSEELDSYVGSLGSSGQGLAASDRQFFESKFGHDFSGVKIHTGADAAQSAESINAKAYTSGNNIVFNDGQYAPESDSGKRLIAHELTHVVQQSQSAGMVQKDTDADKAKAAADEAKKKADLIAKIKGYGISEVEDVDGAVFTSAQLDLVDKAFAGLPIEDKAAIKGAKLRRLTSLGDKTGGRYTNTQSYSGTSSSEEHKIELSNAAFGSLPASESVRIITHEVGHAIAAMPQRLAMGNEIATTKTAGALNDTMEKSRTEFNNANDTGNAAITEYNNAVLAYRKAQQSKNKDAIAAADADVQAKKKIKDALQSDTDTKKADFNAKKKGAEAAIKDLAVKKAATQSKFANIDDLKASAAAKLRAMQAAYNGASAIIKGSDADSADYRASLTDAESAIKGFYDDNAAKDMLDADAVDTAKAAVDTIIKDRNTKRDALNAANPKNTITPATAALEVAQNSFLDVAALLAYNKRMSLLVRKFYDFVVKNVISPALTPYAAENWPAKPEEFYAEAYSFFITKPTDLETYSKPLYDWFKAGNYK